MFKEQGLFIGIMVAFWSAVFAIFFLSGGWWKIGWTTFFAFILFFICWISYDRDSAFRENGNNIKETSIFVLPVLSIAWLAHQLSVHGEQFTAWTWVSMIVALVCIVAVFVLLYFDPHNARNKELRNQAYQNTLTK